MSARPLAPELVRALKRLCLGKLLDAMPERLALAEERGLAVDDRVDQRGRGGRDVSRSAGSHSHLGAAWNGIDAHRAER